jgi:hypothetical protein
MIGNLEVLFCENVDLGHFFNSCLYKSTRVLAWITFFGVSCYFYQENHQIRDLIVEFFLQNLIIAAIYGILASANCACTDFLTLNNKSTIVQTEKQRQNEVQT